MLIPRPLYLQKLIASKGNNMIKIITGIRRCGKSFLLSNIFRNYLNSVGVTDDHIIHIALDDLMNKELRNPEVLLRHIRSQILDDKDYFVLLDEVQMVENFVEVLNSLLHIKNVDAYVTGSNSRFLSKDIVTEFRGRGQDIHMYPLSFSEYYSALSGDRSRRWREYYTYGGLPQILLLADDSARREYLMHLDESVFIADVIERNKVRNKSELEDLLKVLASSIGAPCNPTKLSNTFRSLKNKIISNKTISNYLTYLCDAFIVEKAVRYNVKGKRYINTLAKYYFTDIGLRNALLGFRQLEQTHIMENVIFNELLYRGYSVDVGVVEVLAKDKIGKQVRKQFEVDFVVNHTDRRYYIQSAYSIPDEDKYAQETASFRNIPDSFKRIIIVRDDITPYQTEEGVVVVGLFDFLLDPQMVMEG